MRAEILIDPKMAPRGRNILDAMVKASPIPVVVRKQYVGDCEILMTYGIGHNIRGAWWNQHRRRGGRCIAWDLGYWGRADGSGSMRVTIDRAHPHHLIRPESPVRFDASGITLREDRDKNGPIILVGMGMKSVRMYGLKPLEWERATLLKLRRKYPNNEIIYKPKRTGDLRIERTRISLDPIEVVLKGAALVVCRHSNVAVDACVAGVPVICEDGAAFALYRDNKNPTPEQRLQFLRSLAWWQWTPEEAPEAWKYLLNRLSA